MAQAMPFIRFVNLRSGAEPDTLMGFALPFLPDMLTSHWLSSPDPHKRLEEALQLQIRLINAFWSMGITAWDLRFIGTDQLPGVAIGLICRIHRPSKIEPGVLRDYCLTLARQAQTLFADYGYELLPLVAESSLIHYLNPFQFQAVGEVQKAEKLLSFEDAYTEYEIYVTYPWQWRIQNRLRLFEALLHRQSNCLVSIYVEPTHLSSQEQSHLNHAISPQMQSLIYDSGPIGQTVYQVYADYARRLRQPYLLRIGLAASTPQALQHIGRIFIDELHTPQRAGPILLQPQNAQEWQWACNSLTQVECIPWGKSPGMDVTGTARLRYLVDDTMASMAFRLPVAQQGDLPGIPVRSLSPSTSNPPATRTYQPSFHSSPTASTSDHQSLSSTGISTSGSFVIQQPEDLVGKTLGSCHIEALLGQGGFGAVYRARQAHLVRFVAVKVILAISSRYDQQERHKLEQRFIREAQAIARLDHPYILALYEYQSSPVPHIIMPYVAGGSLADELEASGHRPLPPSGVTTILQQIASALDHAHQKQLVHRDIKPHNLLRHEDGRLLLADFGIVQFEDDDRTALTTHKQHTPYTPSYASPEQHQWQKVDYRTDIYSLGIVIYELLCGQRPFTHPFQHVQLSPPAMNSYGVQVHPALEAVVVKALSKQPQQRYQSAGEMAAAFLKAGK